MIKLKGLSNEEIKSCIPYEPVIVGYRGSIAHGMYVPSKDPNSIDDKDIMGVTMGPNNIYVGLNNYEGSEKFIREWDVVTYDIKKFFRLLIKCNPNVFSLLWLEPRHYIFTSLVGEEIIANRNIFSSKKAYFSYTGYAHGQLHRMTHQSFKGYMGEKRKKLVEKFHYDCKNASHLIRILRMGIEFLNEGIMYVQRHDAQQLLEIKKGEWSLERVQREADRLFVRAEEAYDKSSLPTEPDFAKIETILVDILKRYVAPPARA